MPSTFISSNLIGSGNQIALGSTTSQSVLIAAGVYVLDTSTNGLHDTITGNGNNQGVYVHGYVGTTLGQAVNLAGADVYLAVGTTGVIESLEPRVPNTTSSAVVALNSGAVSNAGHIRGDFGVAFLNESRLFNSGTIEGFSTHAVRFRTLGQLVNSGTIVNSMFGVAVEAAVTLELRNMGQIIGGVFGGSAEDVIVNTGQITGDISLFGGFDRYDGRYGQSVGFVSGGSGNDTILGGAGDEDFRGGFDDDSLRGGAGDDALKGDAGNDTLLGGLDDDTALGGDGNDLVHGNAGDDSLSGEAGDDQLNGGDGFDALFGGDGNDTAQGSFGDDQIEGGTGNDLLNGGAGDDVMLGNDHNDRVNGDAGNDDLFGGRNFDTLTGGAGDDSLSGGANRDQLSGGIGADVFIYAKATDSNNSSDGDTIRDFEVGLDLIDLSAVAPGDLAFQGSAGFAGGGVASLRFTVSASGATSVFVDTNGDGVAEMRINMVGTLALTAADFIL